MSDDYEDIFDDMEKFYQRFTERMSRQMKEINEAFQSGKIEGNWDITPIEEPGMSGFIARGRFQLGKDQFGKPHPPKPLKPSETLNLPEQVTEEVREPLTDVFKEKEQVKIYLELPGAEKNEIQLSVKGGQIDVETKKFCKNIELPTKDIDCNNASAKYKNGFLEITIPIKTKATTHEQAYRIKID